MVAAQCHGTINDGTAIKALNKYWHREHFNCATCSKPFADGKFFESDGLPYCQDHYHAKRGTVCGKCHKCVGGRGLKMVFLSHGTFFRNIDGMCISALEKKWHQECFVCTKCKGVLKGQVMMSEDLVYCAPCAKTL